MRSREKGILAYAIENADMLINSNLTLICLMKQGIIN